MSSAWSKHRALLALVAAGALALGISSGLLGSKVTGARSHAAAQKPTAAARSPAAAQLPATPAPEQWWKPLPTATAAFQPTLLVIEKLKIQAPVEIKGVDGHNVMEVPDSPADAAWYRFTA